MVCVEYYEMETKYSFGLVVFAPIDKDSTISYLLFYVSMVANVILISVSAYSFGLEDRR